MSLDFTKVNYVDGSTIIEADNLNDIQDAILALDNNKVEAESGKGLSTEDYTTAEKTKLSGIEAGAQVNPGNATTSADGLMSSVDKAKLDGIATGATAVAIDSTLAVAGQAADAKATGDALAEKYEKPSGGIPKTDLASAVQTSLNKADSALQQHQDISGKADKVQSATNNNFAALDANGNLKDSGHKASDFLTEHQSLAAYRTSAEQDTIDAGKQAKITVSGMLKGDGEGGVSAAVAGTDYQTPLTAGTDYETPAGAKALGLTCAAVGDLVRVASVDANGKPTSWRKAPLCEIKTNPNLLDNWYFVGGGSQQGGGQFPLNQRGQASYSAGYGIDRWSIVNTSMTLTNNGITLYGLKQLLEKSRIADGLIYTLSVHCSTGVFSATAILNSNTANSWQIDQSFDGGWFGIRFSGSTWEVCITSSNNTVFYAVKLELGSEQTLAHIENGAWLLNEIPNYEQELMKCQRYCIVYKTSSSTRSLLALGVAESTTQYRAVLPTPVTMRHSNQRSVELTGTVTAGSLTASSVTSYWEENPGSITLFVNVTGATVDNVAKIMLEHGSTLTISADL